MLHKRTLTLRDGTVLRISSLAAFLSEDKKRQQNFPNPPATPAGALPGKVLCTLNTMWSTILVFSILGVIALSVDSGFLRSFLAATK